MSEAEDDGPHRLIARLAATPGAVPALIALYDAEANVTRAGLDQACGGEHDTGYTIQWLIAVGLARCASSTTVDDPAAVYELTDVGRTLTHALIDLARALAEPVIDEP